MLFSVVIPTYNRLSLLPRTLEFVWRQRFTDYEVILVDDGSTDGTQEYLRGIGNKVRTINQANLGPGAARNVGAREAKGEYVAFLDSDDLWFPWTLDVFARAIQEHRRPHLLGGKFIEFTERTELLAVREESYETTWFVDYIASSRYPYYVGSGTCILRREAFAGVTFLEDRLNAEDHDLILQMGNLPDSYGWSRRSRWRGDAILRAKPTISPAASQAPCGCWHARSRAPIPVVPNEPGNGTASSPATFGP